MRPVIRCAAYVWASPWTALGLALGLLGACSGGRLRRHTGIVECHGGAVTRLLAALPLCPLALTLGHTVLGMNAAALDITRDHERVHVRQYERWGPFFIPAYFGWSLLLWCRGKNPYRDNPFEREAYSQTTIDPRGCPP